MATADEQIRVSSEVKAALERRKRGDESYNDVIERLLGEQTEGSFYDSFGTWSEAKAETIRERRRAAKAERKERLDRHHET